MTKHNMIQNSNAKDLSGMNQSLCAVSILSAGSRIPGRVVMNEYQSSAAISDRRSKNLSWVYHRCAQAADGHQDLAYKLVFRIQVQ